MRLVGVAAGDAAGQQEDGGWTFNWLAWSPLATAEWRGSLTVDALVILRENGRLSEPPPEGMVLRHLDEV